MDASSGGTRLGMRSTLPSILFATGSFTPKYLSLMFWLASSPVVGISCRYGHSAPRLHSPRMKKVHTGARFLCTTPVQGHAIEPCRPFSTVQPSPIDDHSTSIPALCVCAFTRYCTQQDIQHLMVCQPVEEVWKESADQNCALSWLAEGQQKLSDDTSFLF